MHFSVPGWWISVSSQDRKSTRLNSSHGYISYAVFCLKKKKTLSVVEGLLHLPLSSHSHLRDRFRCRVGRRPADTRSGANGSRATRAASRPASLKRRPV